MPAEAMTNEREPSGLAAIPLLEVSKLAAGYGRVQVLQDVSLTVKSGSITALLGSNGVGKSTLMRVIAGLLECTRGEVFLAGKQITRVASHVRVNSGLALVPEGRQIFGDFTVEENLKLGAFIARARESSVGRLERMWQLFPRLAERRKQRASTLSGGEQQMLAIGRGLMSDPTLLLLDEPSIGLSPVMTDHLFQTIDTVRASGVTIFIVEQNALSTLDVADYAYVIEGGSVRLEGPGRELARNPAIRTAYLGL
jgi:branched-chain amino acid transport system ATP-binding protein